LDLLAQPKKMRRGFGAPKEPLRVLGESPVTKQPVQLLEGRYGLYVADGVSNASLPKGSSVEELTLEQALELLAARAARGPAKKPTRRRVAAPAAKKSANRSKPSPMRESADTESSAGAVATKAKPKPRKTTRK
jgi:DNA topoisomerase-1